MADPNARGTWHYFNQVSRPFWSAAGTATRNMGRWPGWRQAPAYYATNAVIAAGGAYEGVISGTGAGLVDVTRGGGRAIRDGYRAAMQPIKDDLQRKGLWAPRPQRNGNSLQTGPRNRNSSYQARLWDQAHQIPRQLSVRSISMPPRQRRRGQHTLHRSKTSYFNNVVDPSRRREERARRARNVRHANASLLAGARNIMDTGKKLAMQKMKMDRDLAAYHERLYKEPSGCDDVCAGLFAVLGGCCGGHHSSPLTSRDLNDNPRSKFETYANPEWPINLGPLGEPFLGNSAYHEGRRRPRVYQSYV